MKLGRERAEYLMQELDHPERSFPSIHIAGTNGKGTVTVVAAAVLEACGFKTGRFTSPHLVRFNERICIDRREIDDDYIKSFLENHDELLQKSEASFFEVTTALAFEYFRDQHVDVAIVETGLGGRLDATSVLSPKVSVITSIGYDHTEILGKTLPEIAAEKAGIIKKGKPVLTIPQSQDILNVFKDHTDLLSIIDPHIMFSDVMITPNGMQFKLTSLDGTVNLPLHGQHLLNNVALAISAVEIFLDRSLSIQEIQAGFDLVSWKGRFEIIAKDPDIIYDVAHNIDSIKTFCKTAREIYSNRSIYIILGLLEDKSPEIILKELEKLSDHIWITPVNSHRSMTKDKLSELAQKYTNIEVAESIYDACEKAYSFLGKNTILAIIGSHYIAEDVYNWRNKK